MRCHGLARDRARLFRCYPVGLVGSEPFLCTLGLSDHGHTPGQQGSAAVLQEFLRSTSVANSASLLNASAASLAAAAGWHCGPSNLVGLCRVEPHLLVECHQLLWCRHAIRALWSLAVEEQFYLLWPAAVRNFSRRALAFCALAVFLGCPLLRAIAFAYGHPAEVWYAWMVADGLASGSLLAISSRTLLTDRRSMKWFSALCITASLLLISLGARFGTLSPVPPTTLLGASLRWTLFNVLFTGMLGTALLLGSSGWARIVRRPVLQFFGEISYGLYLIHTLVFEVTGHFVVPVVMRLARLRVQGDAPLPLIRFLVGAMAATLIAFLSRRYFEEPFLKLKDKWAAATVESASLPDKVRIQAAVPTSRTEPHCIPGD